MQEVSTPAELMNLKPNLYLEVCRQIEKDFTLSGILIDWSVDIQPKDMWSEVLSKLNDLLKNEPEALRNLLYRVDLDEKSISDALLENKQKDFLSELAKQLIAREIQKVLNRLNSNMG